MMSSVIPARLEFQCGHAALVSLPRVKGESSAQRIDRIAREKSAAQARSCDFCPPPLTIADVAQAIVVVSAKPECVAPVAFVAPAPAPVELPLAPVGLSVAVEEELPPVLELPVLPAVTTTITKRVVKRRAARNGHTSGYQFVVRYRTEAVLEATDIRDALRQAELLGAADVLGLAVIG